MSWKDSLSVDVVSIDKQHQTLISAVTGFFDRIRASMPPRQLLEELDQIIDLVGDHFDYEERVMQNINLPSLTVHRSLHKALLEEINEFREEVAMGANERSPDDIEHFLNAWLYRHIVEEDQKIGKHLQQ